MKSILLLPTLLLLAFAANPAHAQSKDESDKARGTVNSQSDLRRAQSSRETATERAQRQRRAEEQARAERFPPMPRNKPPSSSSSSKSSSSSSSSSKGQ